MKILFLVNKVTYQKKMSRVRFHGIRALQKIADVKIKLTHSTGLKNPSLYELYGSSSSSCCFVGLVPVETFVPVYRLPCCSCQALEQELK